MIQILLLNFPYFRVNLRFLVVKLAMRRSIKNQNMGTMTFMCHINRSFLIDIFTTRAHHFNVPNALERLHTPIIIALANFVSLHLPVIVVTAQIINIISMVRHSTSTLMGYTHLFDLILYYHQ